MADVTVVDSKIANLGNLVRALQAIGVTATVSDDPAVISRSSRVILPGVGAFSAGIEELRAKGLHHAIQDVASSGTPLLGICLGMQLLLDSSTEGGFHVGLGLISGTVVAIPSKDTQGRRERKVPHIGWSSIFPRSVDTRWADSILSDTRAAEYFYFVHSFMAVPIDQNTILAQSTYDGTEINAALAEKNVTGVQFHPERSGPAGLALLAKFSRMEKC